LWWFKSSNRKKWELIVEEVSGGHGEAQALFRLEILGNEAMTFFREEKTQG